MRVFSVILLLLCTLTSWAETATVVDGTRVNLRSGRADTYRIIKSLEPGTQVETMREEAGYTQVKTTTGEVGWLPTRMLKIEEPPKQADGDTPSVTELQSEITKLRTELAQMQKPQSGAGAGKLWLVGLVCLVTGVLVGMGGLRAYYLKRLKGLRI